MTKRKDDLIPVVPARGAAPTFPARQPERTVTEDAVLQHENSSHMMISGGMLDGKPTRRLINVFRSSITDPVTNLFKRGVDNLDDVLDSSSYGRTVLSYLTSGKIIKLFRSAIDEPAANLFKRGTDTLDDVLNSATYGRPLLSRLSSGKPLIDFTESIHLNSQIGGGNLLSNSGFESGVGSWVVYDNGPGPSSFVVTSAAPYQGALHARVTWAVQPSDTMGLRNVAHNRFQTGRFYVVSFYAKNASALSVGMGIYWNHSPNVQDTIANPNLSTAYQRYAFRVFWNTGATVDPDLFISILRGSCPATGTLDIDCVQIEEGQAPTAYKPKAENQDDVLDGSTYARALASRLSSGRPVINFFENIHLNDQIITARDCPVSKPTVVTASVSSGSALGAWTAGRALSFGMIEYAVQANGGIVDLLAWDSTGGSGPNGYIFRFDGRSGQIPGQILKVVNGSWLTGGGGLIGAGQTGGNAAALTGWHHVRIMFRPGGIGRFDIWVDGVWAWSVGALTGSTSAADTTYACNSGQFYYGYEVVANPLIAPVAFGQDQRRQNAVSVANYNSQQTSRPLSATGNGAGSGSITIAAHTVQYGWGTVSYNSGTINSLAAGTTPYQVYADDPTFAGGAVTYVASQDLSDVTANNGRYYVGAVAVPPTATTVGASSGGGGSTKLH